jgi:hypothetical protein
MSRDQFPIRQLLFVPVVPLVEGAGRWQVLSLLPFASRIVNKSVTSVGVSPFAGWYVVVSRKRNSSSVAR